VLSFLLCSTHRKDLLEVFDLTEIGNDKDIFRVRFYKVFLLKFKFLGYCQDNFSYKILTVGVFSISALLKSTDSQN